MTTTRELAEQMVRAAAIAKCQRDCAAHYAAERRAPPKACSDGTCDYWQWNVDEERCALLAALRVLGEHHRGDPSYFAGAMEAETDDLIAALQSEPSKPGRG